MQVKKPIYELFLLALLVATAFEANAKEVLNSPKSTSKLSLIENKGQINDQYQHPRNDIDFRLSGNDVSVFVSNNGLHYQWLKNIDSCSVQSVRMDVELLNSNPAPQLFKEQKMDFFERYYQPSFGQSGITAHAYEKVTYKNVYPNIDWVLYIKEGRVEYDFVIHKGGKVTDIKLQYNGASNLSILQDGSIQATTPLGAITESAPNSFQMDGKFIRSKFKLDGNILSFEVDPFIGELTIDPSLAWSTYYGGIADEIIKNGSVTADSYGNSYLCGHTTSLSNIATTGSFKDTLTKVFDAFLVKFNAAGVRTWATYYGGTLSDYGWATTCDTAGNVYLTGYSSSTGLATSGSHQSVSGGGTDAFLVKFDSSGSRIWSSYFGGSATEQSFAVACDVSGNVFIAGYTNNSLTGIATTGAHQTTGGGGQDVFLEKFNSSGVRQWGTYYGGSDVDWGLSLACDQYKNVFLSGYSLSNSGIATAGTHQTTNAGGTDAFLAKFDSTGARIWGTYYGGPSLDKAFGLTVDQAGNSYITGPTGSSSGIATTGSHKETYLVGGGGADAFVARFDVGGARMWGTYYGSTGDDAAQGICYNPAGYIYITGTTTSDTGIATPGSIKDSLDFQDAFIVKFDTSGKQSWGTYFGGEDADNGLAICFNKYAKIFISGRTASISNLSTTGSHQSTKSGGLYDAFLAQIDDCDLTAPTALNGPDTVCRYATAIYSVPAVPGAIAYEWTLPSGWTGFSTADTISVTVNDNSDTIRVKAVFWCEKSVDFIKLVSISGLPSISPAGTFRFCSGDSIRLSTPAAVSYQWLKNGLPITGENTAANTVHHSGIYTVVVENKFGCNDTATADTVIVHPLPLPVITATGTILATGSFTAYQWSRNGVAITGADGSFYSIIVPSGDYTVTVTDSNGCSGISLPFDADKLSVRDAVNSKSELFIYPNPASKMLRIQGLGASRLIVSTIEGKRVAIYENTNEIDVSAYADGSYIIRITTIDGAFIGTEKFIKQSKN